MDGSTGQVVIAAIGVAGTLAAALVSQLLSRRAERDRRREEDRSRWLADRQRLYSRFLAQALSLERDLWSACSMLDQDARDRRIPGYTSILLTPEEGVDGILDALTRTILVEATERGFHDLDKLELVAAEITIIGASGEAAAARNVLDALWDVVGMLEGYARFTDAADGVEACRAARDQFARAARVGLRVDGEFLPHDRHPDMAKTLTRADRCSSGYQKVGPRGLRPR